jgi:hypothetical protein
LHRAEPVVEPESSVKLQNVLETLRARELLQDVTSEDLGPLSATQQLTVYVGFDPTADALHVGNLLGILVLSWFQRCGHRGIALLGGATGRVGDPSGKSAERPVLSAEEIEKNVLGIGGIISSILDRNRGNLPPVKVRISIVLYFVFLALCQENPRQHNCMRLFHSIPGVAGMTWNERVSGGQLLASWVAPVAGVPRACGCHILTNTVRTRYSEPK